MYEYYCKELFVVKSKTRYSCASAIYFNLESDVIKANCEFQYYYNKTDIKPATDSGYTFKYLFNVTAFYQEDTPLPMR